MTECGAECCDHCGGSGKIRLVKSMMVEYDDFDGDVARGLKPMFTLPVLITLGMHRLFNQDSGGDYPLIVIREVIIA